MLPTYTQIPFPTESRPWQGLHFLWANVLVPAAVLPGGMSPSQNALSVPATKLLREEDVRSRPEHPTILPSSVSV